MPPLGVTGSLLFGGSKSYINPLKLPSLLFWIDATKGITGTLNAGIDQAADQSGNGSNANGTAPQRPVWQSGSFKSASKPGIYFEDPGTSTDYLDIAGPNDPSATSEFGIVCDTAYSCFVTFKSTNTNTISAYAGNPPCPIVCNNKSWIYNGFGLSGGNVQYRNFVSAWTTTTSTALSLNDGGVHTICVVHTQTAAGTVTLYADGSQVASQTGTGYHTGYTGCSSIALSYGGDYGGNTTVAEVMLCNAELSAQNVTDLHTRATALWMP